MELAEYNSSYSLFLVYDVGNIYFDLAQTQQHFQTIVQLTHARPTMSCIHLVLCHLLNSVLSYIISGLNLLWSNRSYTNLEWHVHTEFWDSAVYPVEGTGFLSFFHAIHNYKHCMVQTPLLMGSLWSMAQNYDTMIFIVATNGHT